MALAMSRSDIESIKVGQLGLYQWDKSLPVCDAGEVREVLVGRNKGKVFRYVQVKGNNSTIGFVVAEGDEHV